MSKMGQNREATPIAILASGRGSNFDAIQSAIVSGELDAEIKAVISDFSDAPVLEKAQKQGIPVFFVDLKGLQRVEQSKKILAVLEPLEVRFLVLAGFMRILGKEVLEAFRSERGYFRVVNVHPSLLPAFPGVDSYRQAFEYGAAVSGVTVHLVDEKMDHGPICAQEAFSIADCKNVAEVEKRGLALEHRLFPKTLKWVLKEEFQFHSDLEGRPRVCPS